MVPQFLFLYCRSWLEVLKAWSSCSLPIASERELIVALCWNGGMISILICKNLLNCDGVVLLFFLCQ